MNKILVSTLVPNTYFSSNVYLDDKFILISPVTSLNEQLVSRLKQWNFGYVYTEGHPVDSPMVESASGAALPASSLEVDIREQEYVKDAAATFKELLEYTERVFTDFVTNKPFLIKTFTEKIKDISEKIRERKNFILRFNELEIGDKSYIVAHTAKTVILSLVIGLHFKYPSHKLIELGISALVHEIGMARLPPQLYMMNRLLALQEKRAITAHPVLAFKALRGMSFPLPICMAVLEHHEHVDGSGYPRSLTGDKISQPAKIIAVSDAYAALISDRPYRSAKDGHTSVMEILKDRNKRYDDEVLKALLYSLSVFPIGSHVMLANGGRGQVVDVNPDNPKAPIVKLLVNAGGERLRDPVLVRTEDKDNQISRMLTQQEALEPH